MSLDMFKEFAVRNYTGFVLSNFYYRKCVNLFYIDRWFPHVPIVWTIPDVYKKSPVMWNQGKCDLYVEEYADAIFEHSVSTKRQRLKDRKQLKKQ